MQTANTSETSVNFYYTTRRNIPEDSHLQRITIILTFAYSEFQTKSSITVVKEHEDSISSTAQPGSH
jgi:hypothetical protein